MCEPTTIALAVSAAAGAYGAYQSTSAQRQQADAQSKIARNNAVIAGYQREDAIQRGGLEAAKAQREAQRLRGAQVVRLAANGLDLNSGSPLAILEDTDYFGQQDAQTIRNNAARQAWGYEVEQSNQGASASMYSAAARNADPTQAAGLSLLSSAAQFYGAKAGKQGSLSADINGNINNSGLY